MAAWLLHHHFDEEGNLDEFFLDGKNAADAFETKCKECSDDISLLFLDRVRVKREDGEIIAFRFTDYFLPHLSSLEEEVAFNNFGSIY